MAITHLSSVQQLDAFLNEAPPDQVSVIDFHATWCGPCHMIAPTYEALSLQHPNVKFFKCDVDVARDVSQKYSVSAMPTFVFLKGKEIATDEQKKAHTIRGANKAALEAAVVKLGGSKA